MLVAVPTHAVRGVLLKRGGAPASNVLTNYTLQVEPPAGWEPPEPTGRPRSWATTFYPGVARREQAGPIALAAGSDLRGLEIQGATRATVRTGEITQLDLSLSTVR